MRTGFFLLLLFLGAAEGRASSAPLLGHWFFYKKIFRGVEMPEPPEATLRLHFEFHPGGISRLYWWHEGEPGRCAREGRYRVEGSVLVEEATWIDPSNHPSCGRDPDMQKGKVSRTRFFVRDGDLHTFLPFGDEELVYVWKRVGAASRFDR